MNLLRSLAILLSLSALIIVAARAQNTSRISVGANVQVSKPRSAQPHYEVVLAADPNNPKHLLASSMLMPEEPAPSQMFHTVVYASFDGGASWQETALVAEGWQTADPTCAYGPDGTAYFAVLSPSYRAPEEPNRMLFYRSADGGQTWMKPTVLPAIDREYITVDTAGGKYRGRIYLNGTGSVRSLDDDQGALGGRLSDLDVWRSLDGGATFHPPLKLAATKPNHVVEGMGNGVVLSDGTFMAITGQLTALDNYFQTRPYKAIGRIIVVSSSNGGESLNKPVTVSDWYIDFHHKVTSGIVPSLAVDGSDGPFQDRLYAVWPDVRSGRSEILLAYSADKGKTWSKPITINDDEARANVEEGPDNGMPIVAVNSAGVVGVMWYDRRESPDNLGYWPRFSASLDGGETFSPSVKVSAAPATLEGMQSVKLYTGAGGIGGGSRIQSSRGGNLRFFVGVGPMQFSGGHTNGLVATRDGDFQALWVDNRTGIAQVWTAPVKVQGRALRHGAAELAELQEITDKVTLDLAQARYDRTKNVVSVEAYLANTSKETLSGPIKLRVLSLQTKMGAIAITNADNREVGSGAVWDFSDLLGGGALKPEARSRPKRLEFKFSNVPPSAFRSYDALLRMIQVEAKVLAAPASKRETP
jgi:hypothetical protein